VSKTNQIREIRDLKHELVNSLSALKSVHAGLGSPETAQEADRLLLSVIHKLENLKTSIQQQEEIYAEHK